MTTDLTPTTVPANLAARFYRRIAAFGPELLLAALMAPRALRDDLVAHRAWYLTFVVGLLPLLLYDHDHPPKVAIIGYGSGVTAGAATQYPIASLEVVELEPAIYEAAHFFDDVNHRPTENPKVRALAGDGRNFLSQRRDLFDVIISQPSNPWITGVSNLFTREYFQSVRSRLFAWL